MLQSYFYGGYSVEYSSITGDTTISDCWGVVKIFYGEGYHDGKELAEKYIDNINKQIK